MEEALKTLLQKYDVSYDARFQPIDGSALFNKELNLSQIPLQAWRSDRRFVELYKLVDNNTIENVCLLRFAHSTDGNTPIEQTLYKELDLVEYIGHSKIVSIHAVFTDDRTGNVIVKLANDVLASVEVCNLLPEGQSELERHEVVARRGVANDLPVDVQIPLQSIYTFTTDGNAAYRDVDFELYGFSEKEIQLIRAQFDFFKDTTKAQSIIAQHDHLCALVKAALLSNQEHKKINCTE